MNGQVKNDPHANLHRSRRGDDHTYRGPSHRRRGYMEYEVKEPKFKIGEQVRWKNFTVVVQGFREYGDAWVYDFFPTQNTLLPFHFTGIPEREVRTFRTKRWWEFWK